MFWIGLKKGTSSYYWAKFVKPISNDDSWPSSPHEFQLNESVPTLLLWHHATVQKRAAAARWTHRTDHLFNFWCLLARDSVLLPLRLLIVLCPSFTSTHSLLTSSFSNSFISILRVPSNCSSFLAYRFSVSGFFYSFSTALYLGPCWYAYSSSCAVLGISITSIYCFDIGCYYSVFFFFGWGSVWTDDLWLFSSMLDGLNFLILVTLYVSGSWVQQQSETFWQHLVLL